MDLRSGAVTKEYRKQKKTKKERYKPTNKSEQRMAESILEQSLKEMLTGFKDAITREIGELKQDFEKFSTEMKQIRVDINNFRSEVREVKDNLQEAEQRIHQLEEREVFTNDLIKHINQEQKILNEQLEHMEMRSRQNNIRIYKIKEGAEGEEMLEFIRSLLAEKLDITPDTLQITAAYRSSSKTAIQENVAPRSFNKRFYRRLGQKKA